MRLPVSELEGLCWYTGRLCMCRCFEGRGTSFVPRHLLLTKIPNLRSKQFWISWLPLIPSIKLQLFGDTLLELPEKTFDFLENSKLVLDWWMQNIEISPGTNFALRHSPNNPRSLWNSLPPHQNTNKIKQNLKRGYQKKWWFFNFVRQETIHQRKPVNFDQHERCEE